ncbi:MAG TPA: hypothetical protein VLQ68_00435 [Rhizobiaceae bacterium]|nr:hypothetical protein [Rhizobiaceae bacterium]
MRIVKPALLMLLLASPSMAQEADEPVWVLTGSEGPSIATYAAPGGPPLVSVGCDAATDEIVIFRAVQPPVNQTEFALISETGQLRLTAAPDPAGTPGLIARAPAGDTFFSTLARAATVTFRVTGEEGNSGGIAAPVSDPLRQVIDSCLE